MNKNIQYIRFSSIFVKSVIILSAILIIPSMFIVSQIFSYASLDFNTNKYNNLIVNGIDIIDGKVTLTDEVKNIILKENLWIQFIDNSLNEIYSYNKPDYIPQLYDPLSFADSHKNGIKGNTVFVYKKDIEDRSYTYFLGFKNNEVEKSTLVFSPKKLKWVLRNIGIVFAADILLIILFSYCYFSRKLVKPVEKVIEYIFSIADGDLNITIEQNKVYQEVFICLDNLRKALIEKENQKDKLDKIREKWVSYISHDLKTPLSSIKGFSELMKDEEYLFSDEEYRNYSSIIYNKTLYIEELINDLNFSYKIKNGKVIPRLEKVNLTELIRNLISELLLDPNFKEKKILVTSMNENISVMLDIKLMKRALSNLIVNFLIYNEKDAKIILKVLEDNDLVSIVLRDNGRGMNEVEIENIFNEYFRGTNTNSNQNGSGLGMAIANEVIKLHNGECLVTSKEGVGTTLKITLKQA